MDYEALAGLIMIALVALACGAGVFLIGYLWRDMRRHTAYYEGRSKRRRMVDRLETDKLVRRSQRFDASNNQRKESQ